MIKRSGIQSTISHSVKRCFKNAETTLFLVLILVFMPIFSIQAQGKVKLAAEDASWLTEKGQPIIECAFRRIGVSLTIERVPWKRAQAETQTGKYTGFFMASENEDRNEFATFSESFMSVEWIYVIRKTSEITPQDPDFNSKIFAANTGSSRFNWLDKKQKKNEIYYKIFSADTSEQLLKMLLLKRMDVVLENRANFEKITTEGQIDIAKFRTYTALTRPLAVYFGHAFLHRNPDFLEEYNESIRYCTSK